MKFNPDLTISTPKIVSEIQSMLEIQRFDKINKEAVEKATKPIIEKIVANGYTDLKGLLLSAAENGFKSISHFLFDTNLVKLNYVEATNTHDQYLIDKVISNAAKTILDDKKGETNKQEANKQQTNKKQTNKEEKREDASAGVKINVLNTKSSEGVLRKNAMEQAVLPVLKQLHESGVDILGELTEPTPSLFYAIRKRKLDVVEYLVSIGANVNMKIKSNDSYQTSYTNPLIEAVNAGDAEITDFLIKHGATSFDGAKLNSQIASSESIPARKLYFSFVNNKVLYEEELNNYLSGLYRRCYFNSNRSRDTAPYRDYTLFLIGKGATNISSESISGVFESGDQVLIDAVMSTNPSLSNFPFVKKAIEANNTALFNKLLGYGCDINTADRQGNTALSSAINSKNGYFFLVLKKNGVNLNDTKAAVTAFRLGKYNIAKLLFDAGVSPNSSWDLLLAAAEKKSLNALNMLLNYNLCLKNMPSNVERAVIDTDDSHFINRCIESGMTLPSDIWRQSTVAYAASRGLSNTLDCLIQHGFSLKTDSQGNNPLFCALSQGSTNCITMLIKHGATLQGAAENAANILLRSVISNNLQSVKMLLDAGAYWDSRDEKHATALCLAASKNYVDIMKLLVEHGANIEAKDDSNDTAFIYATKHKSYDAMKYLVNEEKCNVQANNNAAFDYAFQTGDIDSINIICGGEFNSGSITLIVKKAVETENLELIKLVISIGGDVNERKENDNKEIESAMDTAVKKGNMKIIKLLLENGAEIIYNGSALYQYVEQRFLHKMRKFIKLGFSATRKQEFSVFPKVVSNGYIEILSDLIQKGVDINEVESRYKSLLLTAINNHDNNTLDILQSYFNYSILAQIYPVDVLISAITNNYNDIAESLINNGAKINDEEKRGSFRTPLIVAVENNNAFISKLLIEKGANVNVADRTRRSPLFIAISNNNLEIVQLLVENGANIEEETKEGKTPFLAAVELGNLEIVKYLVEKGAKINKEDSTGTSALMIAAVKSHNDILKYLLELEATVNKKTILYFIKAGNMELAQNGKATIESSIASNSANYILAAIESQKIEMLDFIFSLGAKITKKSNLKEPLIFTAIKTGKNKIVRKLLENGAEPNVLNEEKNTPLYEATKVCLSKGNGKFSMVQTLLENNANPNLYCDGKAPIHLANSIPLIQLFLQHHADINAKDAAGNTLFSQLLKKSEIDMKMLEFVVENGADINGSNNENVPYFFSIIGKPKEKEILKYLISKDLNINLKDGEGNTYLLHKCFTVPLQVKGRRRARGEKGQEGEIIADINSIIKQYGADPEEENNNGYNAFFACLSRGKVTKLSKDIGEIDHKGKSRAEYALKNDQSDVFSYFMKKSVDMLKYTEGIPLLVYAVKHNHMKIAHLLLSKPENFGESEPKTGKTALMYLVKSGNKDFINEMLSKARDSKALINQFDKRGVTPLMVAANSNQLDIAYILVRRGANIDAVDKNGTSAIHRAMAKNHNEILNFLIKRGGDINAATPNGKTYLMKAIDTMQKKDVNKVIYRSANVNLKVNGVATIFHPLEQGKDSIANMMISQGSQVLDCTNEKGESPFFVACRTGCNTVVNKILSMPGNNINIVNVDGDTPLIAAIENNHTSICSKLIKQGADISIVNKDGNNALMIAASKGTPSLCQQLIDKGADYKQVNKEGRNALSIAVTMGNTSIVKVLINCKSDVNIVDKKQEIPLYTACKRGFTDIASQLAPLTNDINYVCAKTGETPLTEASYHGKAGCVTILLKKGADVNLANSKHKTPLMLAAEKARKATVSLLLEAKTIDTTIKDDDGKTAYDLAKTEEIKELIVPGSVDKKEKKKRTYKEEGKKIKYITIEKTSIVKGEKVTTKRKKRVFVDAESQEKNEEEKESAKAKQEEKKEKEREDKIRKRITKLFSKLPNEEIEEKIQEEIKKEKLEEMKKKAYGGSLLKAAIAKRKKIRHESSSENEEE